MTTITKISMILASATLSTGLAFADISIGTGAGLSGGSLDTNWMTNPSSYIHPVVISPANIPAGCSSARPSVPYCWAPDTATSSWVGLADAIDQPLPSWSISTTITVGAGATLTGVAGFDDYGSLIVNGRAVTLNENGTPATVTQTTDFGELFAFSAALEPGVNTVELSLAPTVGDPSNEGYDAVRLDAIVSTPEPSSYTLLLLTLGGLLVAKLVRSKEPATRARVANSSPVSNRI
jgi:hypothetical protein